MAPSQTHSSDSEADEPVYNSQHQGLASSLAALPARTSTTTSTVEGTEEVTANDSTKAKSGEMKDFLDLATRTSGQSASDISSRLEQKRLEHERQRELQKKAFEEQMKQLELQQEAEEAALASGATLTTATTDSAKSMPATRRHSGELNGNGVPATVATAGAVGGKEVVGEAGGKRGEQNMLNNFTFDDELDADLQNSAWGGKYLQMNTDDDKFPILIRRDSYPGILSASSAALDLAPLSQTPVSQRNFSGPGRTAPSEWPQFQGVRPTDLTSSPATDVLSSERLRSVTQPSETVPGSERSSPRPNRGVGSSGGVGTLPLPLPRNSGTGTVPGSGRNSPVLEKKLGGNGLEGLGKPPLVKGYSSSELNTLGHSQAGYVDNLTDQFSNFNIDSSAFGNSSDPNQGPFGGYGHDHGAFAYDGSAAYGSMGGKQQSKLLSTEKITSSPLYGVNPVFVDQDVETNRFAGLRLEDLQGDMLPLCKDQFGCRYLQKKLEDGNPEHRDMIFNEIFPHFAELMTDPFANYLSQRLLEYSTDEQRDALIESISGELVSISLNMHGTRAVQKMIDYLSTKRQVQSLILALNLNVVTLIKDLNGNHVIQKCLNHLPPEDNQFIYNAVATHCIEVATHRHGCCVLQRCIDHASESQRIQLVTEITYNSLTLVQDAFGNYVVQYVLDLNDNRFIEAIVRQFLGNVSALSAQKFSSNVVEKCIRVADASGRRAIIDELLNKQRLERLLRDSFANYVVQTALDYAEPTQRAQLIETIRPILPMIRNTPYGKRIQSKIQRETSDHMSRSAYGHHPALLQGGGQGGHFYNNMNQNQMNHHHQQQHQQHQQHQGQYLHQQQQHHHQGQLMGHMGNGNGEYGSRSPYLGGGGGGGGNYQNQGPPQMNHQLQYQQQYQQQQLQQQQQQNQQQQQQQQGGHHSHNQSISQFTPFPSGPMGGSSNSNGNNNSNNNNGGNSGGAGGNSEYSAGQFSGFL